MCKSFAFLVFNIYFRAYTAETSLEADSAVANTTETSYNRTFVEHVLTNTAETTYSSQLTRDITNLLTEATHAEEPSTRSSRINVPTTSGIDMETTYSSRQIISNSTTSFDVPISEVLEQTSPIVTNVTDKAVAVTSTTKEAIATSTVTFLTETAQYINTETNDNTPMTLTELLVSNNTGADTSVTSYRGQNTDITINEGSGRNSTTGYLPDSTREAISTEPSDVTNAVETHSATTNRPGEITTTSCTPTTVTVIGVASALVVCAVAIFGVCFFRKRMKWKKKILDERQKTDIWTMHTLNNTIINDNFFDFNLAPPRPEFNMNTFPAPTMRPSHSYPSSLVSELTTSEISYDKNDSRNTLIGMEKMYRMKGPVNRQSSCYSMPSDSVLGLSLDFNHSGRSRTTTFTGRRDGRKANDKHVLVKHDELIFDIAADRSDSGQVQMFTTEL